MPPESVTSKRSVDVANGQNGTNGKNGERAAKRRRLSPEAYGSITTRKTSDLETSLEVDHMILDYLTYQAIETCFAHKHLPTHVEVDKASPVDHALLQVDDFFHLFKSRYPRYIPDNELRLRQALLQLVTLITQRLSRNSSTPSKSALEAIRSKNQRRACEWIGDAIHSPTAGHDTIALFDAELPVPQEELELSRAHFLDTLNAPAEDEMYEDAFYGVKGCVSLLDLLPLFMRVSAICHGMWDSGLTPQWMQLAADWMLQACLEQYLVFGATGSDVMDEAFAWGYKEWEGDGQNGEEQRTGHNDDPFQTEYDQGKAEEWEQIRNHALATLISVKGGELIPHLLQISFDHPIADVDRSITRFLRSLAKAIPEPVLAQLERGKLDGMSEQETQKFMRDECGLDMSRLSLGEF